MNYQPLFIKTDSLKIFKVNIKPVTMIFIILSRPALRIDVKPKKTEKLIVETKINRFYIMTIYICGRRIDAASVGCKPISKG
jgi:hypothetical protein